MPSAYLSEIAALLQIPCPSSAIPIRGYYTDARLVEPGGIFFALPGTRTDGHRYLEQARAQGAVAAVVSKNYQGEVEGLHLLAVADPLRALQELARAWLRHHPARLVAITGSLGKTSTKQFTQTLLSTKYRVAASPGNYNSQIGLPLAILQHTRGDEEVLVLEMGMTERGHLTRLVQIAPPEVAVITTVALVHAANFDSLEEIAWAKGEILSHPETRLGIVHRDIAAFDELVRLGSCHKLSFSGHNPAADYALNSVEDRYEVSCRLGQSTVCLGRLALPGKHNRLNLLAAIAVARHFNVEWEAIKRAMPTLALPEQRLEWVKRRGVLFLNDAYNAAELSVKSALSELPKPEKQGRKVAVLGGMMELGKWSEESHRRVGEFALDQVDQLCCLGEECRPICQVWAAAGRPIHLFDQRKSLVAYLRTELREGDVVLLKGSHSKELWKVLEEF